MKKSIENKNDLKSIFSMKNKITVIIGGTGNLGLNFSDTLSKAGSKVYLLDKTKKKLQKKIFFLLNVT